MRHRRRLIKALDGINQPVRIVKVLVARRLNGAIIDAETKYCDPGADADLRISDLLNYIVHAISASVSGINNRHLIHSCRL